MPICQLINNQFSIASVAHTIVRLRYTRCSFPDAQWMLSIGLTQCSFSSTPPAARNANFV